MTELEQDTLTIKIADWKIDVNAITMIRRIVFIDEQCVPEELEWDDYDEVSTHFLVYVNNNAIATARLAPDGKIGRMAVMNDYRKQGVGKKLLAEIIGHAASKGFEKIYLHAQTDAIDFYKKFNFTATDEQFEEAGILHQAMYRNL